jgi:hypothetical protein
MKNVSVSVVEADFHQDLKLQGAEYDFRILIAYPEF